MRKFWRLLIDFTGGGKTTTQELIHRSSVGSRLAGLERGDGMSAYVVLMQQIDDIDRYVNGYVPATQPLLRKHGAKCWSEAGASRRNPPRVIRRTARLIRFADVEAAWGFPNDPDYQPVKAIRLGTTSRGQAVVTPGFTPASNGGSIP
jgi:uncharacterized protein (DUF1330 family)